MDENLVTSVFVILCLHFSRLDCLLPKRFASNSNNVELKKIKEKKWTSASAAPGISQVMHENPSWNQLVSITTDVF